MNRKSAEQRLYERTVKSLPMLNDESLEALLRLVRQLQTARRMGRSALLNAHSRDGKILFTQQVRSTFAEAAKDAMVTGDGYIEMPALELGHSPRPNANIPQHLESEMTNENL